MLQGSFARGCSFAFTDRSGGASGGSYAGRNLGLHVDDDPAVVAANRAATAAELGLETASLIFMEQTHGDTVHVVTDRGNAGVGPAAEIADCDGLVTSATGIGLVVMVADCVPVLLADCAAGVVSAVHAGRRGVHNGIVERALEHMVGLGASPQGIAVKLGPSICGACYEVPEAMSEEVLAVAPEAATRTPAGTPGLDLRRGLEGVLRRLGVTDVERVGPCTRESFGAADLPAGGEHSETPRYFSYRAAAGRPTGRFAGIVWLDASPAFSV